MGFFSSSKKGGELVALFDIGSSSVAGALVYLKKNDKPQVIFSCRERFEVGTEFKFDLFLNNTLKSLDLVATKISQAKLGSPKKFFCTLSSPWYGSQTRVVRFSKSESFVFNNKLADDLLEKEMSVFKAENAEKYSDFQGRMLPIELKNMKMLLNGYPTNEPIGQKAQELEMTIFISMSSEEFMTKVQEVVFKHFHRDNIKFSSFAFVAFAVARDFFAKHSNFILVDVGGELTELSMVKQDVLVGSASFPKGINFMVRALAEANNSSLSEARSLINLLRDDHASESVKQSVGPVINKVKNDWLAGFQNALANLSHDISVPSHVFISINDEFADFFSEVIKSEQFSQYTLAESKFQIYFLRAQELRDFAELAKGVDRDSPLILESIYINRFLR